MQIKNTVIPDAHLIVKGINSLNDVYLPKHFLKEDALRTDRDFDPNTYFDVLTHLSIIPSYTIDFSYNYSSIAASPILYFRKIYTPRFKTLSEYIAKHEKQNLLDFILSDGSVFGFFELAVFNLLAGKFYLYWHANYYNSLMLTTKSDVRNLILKKEKEGGNDRFTDKQIAAISAIAPEPMVEITDDEAHVTYCIFDDWKGFGRVRESFNRRAPHHAKDRETLEYVEYESGVCY